MSERLVGTRRWIAGRAARGPRAPRLDDAPLATVLRRTARLARLALPDPRLAARVREIRRSGLFDRAFYRATNPGLHPIYRRFPERHYLLFGERAGVWPSAGFSPTAYLARNRDLGALGSPLLHYLRIGRSEGRSAEPMPEGALEPAELSGLARRPPASAFAAAVHVHYAELWPEIRDALRGCGVALDLFVTVSERGAETRRTLSRIRADWPDARVVATPNRGRDILPFVRLVEAGLLDPYAAVCKLHTKRSPHRGDGDRWRRHLVGSLLDPARLPGRLVAFQADAEAALWVADGQIYRGRRHWGPNEARALDLLARAGLAADPAALGFPGGSMCWMKPAVIARVRALGLRPQDFEPEQAQLDGTLAHAFERAFGYLATSGGGAILEASQLDRAARTAQPEAGTTRSRVSAAISSNRRAS